MRLDDASADGEPHAYTFRFGAEEGLEHALDLLRIQADSGVARCVRSKSATAVTAGYRRCAGRRNHGQVPLGGYDPHPNIKAEVAV